MYVGITTNSSIFSYIVTYNDNSLVVTLLTADCNKDKLAYTGVHCLIGHFIFQDALNVIVAVSCVVVLPWKEKGLDSTLLLVGISDHVKGCVGWASTLISPRTAPHWIGGQLASRREFETEPIRCGKWVNGTS